MEKVLKILSGKKGVVASVIMTIVAYLSAEQVLGTNAVVLIGSLTTILFGSASYATAKYIYNK